MATRTSVERRNERMHKIFADAAIAKAKHDKIRETLRTLVRDAAGLDIDYANEALNKAFHALIQT